MQKPFFNADNAEEYFSDLCVSYRETANEIFKRDNDGRHASEQIYSAEYQKFIGMQIAMREVLEYFSKFELIQPQKSNADRIRAMSDEELAKFIVGNANGEEYQTYEYEFSIENVRYFDVGYEHQGKTAEDSVLYWLQQPAEES